MTTLYRLIAFAALITCLIMGGCGYPRHIDPPLYTFETPLLTQLSAEAYAKAIGGKCYRVADTHSMEPVLQGGDYIVVDTRIALEDVKLGQIVNYQADWAPPPAPTVTHRAGLRDKDGLLVEGDNVHPDIDPRTGRDLHSEARWRVTKASYVGVVVSIYRLKP
jgi:hypothetical protein